ncbi:Boron transporter 4 [Linum perenne]
MTAVSKDSVRLFDVCKASLTITLFCLVCRILEGFHASFMELVPFKDIAIFTVMQFVYFLLYFGVTWIPVAEILFPLPFFILIFIRQHILPKFSNLNISKNLTLSNMKRFRAPQREAEV